METVKGSERQMKEVNIVFGKMQESVYCNCDQSTLRILGFIDTDLTLSFESMMPIKVKPDSKLLPSLSVAMKEFALDAVVFAERDMILRARVIERDEGSGKNRRMMLYLCVPKKPLFDTKGQEFEYPNFSLVLPNLLL